MAAIGYAITVILEPLHYIYLSTQHLKSVKKLDTNDLRDR